jgi:RNA recognition motif-containing protein
VRNLDDKLQKEDLKRNLYMLFATYGVILDIVALKTMKMRGQAHVVFRDIDASTQAMRALQGFIFFNKDLVRPYLQVCFMAKLTIRSKSHTQRPSPTQSRSSTDPTRCPNPSAKTSLNRPPYKPGASVPRPRRRRRRGR